MLLRCTIAALLCRFLATGDSYVTVGNSFRVGVSTVAGVVRDTCDAIWSTLRPVYMSEPTEEDWCAIAEQFEQRWQFPNCVGAIDGKHVVLKAPSKSGSLFFNYKGTYSIVLLAVVDANYSFTVIDVGGYGKQSDGGTLAASEFGFRLNYGKLDLPAAKVPVGCTTGLPHVFVADEAFPLTTNLMRPYPGKQLAPCKQRFNYRLSRARRVVENAFGILASRFRVYHRTMDQRPDTVDKIIKATCVLHNMLRKESSGPSNSVSTDDLDLDDDALTVAQLQPLKHVGGRASHEAFAVRDSFCDYFMSDTGKLPWQ